MKSVVLAGWLLTTAAGNLIDVLVTATRVITQVCYHYAHIMALHVLNLKMIHIDYESKN